MQKAINFLNNIKAGTFEGNFNPEWIGKEQFNLSRYCKKYMQMKILSKYLKVVSLTVFLFYITCNKVYSQNWISIIKKNDIEICKSDTKNKNIKKYKAKFFINSNLSGVISLLKDVESYKDWMSDITTAKKLHVENDSVYIYHFFVDAYSIIHKDGSLLVKIKQDKSDKTVYYNANLINIVSKNKGYGRMKVFSTSWVFKPASSNSIAVTYVGTIDVGANMKLVMKIIGNGLFKTMSNMKEIVKKDKYQKAKVNFIENY